MAVAISRTADPASAGGTANVVAYNTQAIGVAAADRIVAICVTAELANAEPQSATIDYGTGAVAMTPGTSQVQGAVYSRIFYAAAPTGTSKRKTIRCDGVGAGVAQSMADYYGITVS